MKKLFPILVLLAAVLQVWAGSVTSLGAVTVTSAGTAVALSSTNLPVKTVMLEAVPANAGTYMILEDVAGNIICKFGKGQSCTPPVPPSGVNLNSLKLDSDHNGDQAYVSYSTEP